MVAAVVAAATIHASVSPGAPARDGIVRVVFEGLPAPAADVIIDGGIASGGKMFGLVPLRDAGRGTWWTALRAPGFLGVYPIRVRAQGRYWGTDGLVKVLPRRFAAEPGVPTPKLVVEWWRRQSPGGADITSVTEWRAGFYYHLDQRYNRLLRVRFTLLAPWREYDLAKGTYTRWFDVARTNLTADWRLVQVVDAP
jgi:hypothetical protein